MSLAGNLNAATVSGALTRFNRAVTGLMQKMIAKGDKEFLLGELRATSRMLGIDDVPAYNSPGFQQWLQQRAVA